MMKYVRFYLFGVLVSCLLILIVVLSIKQPDVPFKGSFAPLFQLIGKPIKTLDRTISQILPIDDIDEKQIGDNIKKHFKQIEYTTDYDKKTYVYLNALVQHLTTKSKKEFTYQVFLLDGPANAFALPGGVVCITKDFLSIIDNEAELVSIIGHEIGHIERGHLFDAVRGDMLRRKIKYIDMVTYVMDVFQILSQITFSKTEEDEADDYGFRLLLQSGYDPIAMSTAFEKIQSLSIDKHTNIDPISDFMMTHPHTAFRIETFRSKAIQWKHNHPKQVYKNRKNNFDEKQF